MHTRQVDLTFQTTLLPRICEFLAVNVIAVLFTQKNEQVIVAVNEGILLQNTIGDLFKARWTFERCQADTAV